MFDVNSRLPSADYGSLLCVRLPKVYGPAREGSPTSRNRKRNSILLIRISVHMGASQ